ncbi:NAD-binding protein [Nonomuraea sp. K274]|uniref:NAD-binding protein n=1 Tax=Nonomuraea cypriaca TaxID=1187855 RepID=A0A931F752_9ACTN|nr:NAD(P)-binding protein [Nonomuraea cypriaca]MBF8193806.1 NAD-binding protein [Nonomuraea cypriaca]
MGEKGMFTSVEKGNDGVAVLGLGSFGRAVALRLTEDGWRVLGVDRDPEVVGGLAGRLDRVAVADTTELASLRRLDITLFEQVVVAMSDLEAGVLTASLLAEMGVADICVRAVTHRRARILKRVGAHRVLLPQTEMAEWAAALPSYGARQGNV